MSKLGRRRRTSSGEHRFAAFTLVELLVVIGIISILIAVLLPALAKARQQANNLVCMSNLRQMGAAVQAYAIVSKGALPFGYWDGGTPTPAGPGTPDATKAADWSALLTQVLSQRGGNTYLTQPETSSIRRMFTDKDTISDSALGPGETIHYSAHPRLMPALEESEHSISHAWGKWPFRKPAKIARIRRASEVVLIMDGTQIGGSSLIGGNDNRASSTAYQIDGHNYDNWDLGYQPSIFPGHGTYLLYNSSNADNGSPISPGPNKDAYLFFATNGTDGMIRWRHLGNRSANFLFVDGHCESRGYRPAGSSGKPSCDLLRSNVNTDLYY